MYRSGLRIRIRAINFIFFSSSMVRSNHFSKDFTFFEQKKENVKKLVLTKKGTHAMKLINFWSKVFFEITFKTIFFFHRYSIMRLWDKFSNSFDEVRGFHVWFINENFFSETSWSNETDFLFRSRIISRPRIAKWYTVWAESMCLIEIVSNFGIFNQYYLYFIVMHQAWEFLPTKFHRKI